MMKRPPEEEREDQERYPCESYTNTPWHKGPFDIKHMRPRRNTGVTTDSRHPIQVTLKISSVVSEANAQVVD
jgi:hypothetical protein